MVDGAYGTVRRVIALFWRATRPLYIPTSVLAGTIGVGAAINRPGARWWLAPIALAALFIAHAGVNVINDVEDFSRGVDAEDKVNSSGVFTTGLMSVAHGRRFAYGLFGVSFALGVGIALFQGPVLFAIGVVGLVVGFLYSAGPRPLKYAGLGEAAIVFVMGPLITQGAYTAVTGDGFNAQAFWVGFAPGLLIAAVLAANNLSDIAGDRAAGIHTLAVRLGLDGGRAVYLAALGLAYLVPVVIWGAGLLSWPVLLPLLTAPVGLARARQARAAQRDGDEGLLTLTPGTAQLHLLFSLLLLTGVIIDRVS